ncbi:putative anti-sigma-YlaC factor YlaD [Pseudonocardia endophytica]|uniref:Putative anti-sigma-YlaC factor YlaD n=2 Tax=Pseudonocardia endophytica TaxID=401976 RepID=A0A4R1I0M1_PSEEN|nr:zf-HC2 domain-containing protein [Pseudonocardia endophytica]TCK25979.1 putative anti-sigma-YlaC factor YlaD [Pseudonocardia endophytica]
MRCDRCRELVSARLDGEDPPDGRAVDAHLAECSGCRVWADRAAAVTRLVRTGPAEPGPDLVGAVVTASATLGPVVRRRRAGTAVRSGLALVGVGQLVLATIAVAGAAASGHDGMHVDGGSVAHALHETSAWNLAIGIGFLAVAWLGGRLVAGLLPVTGAFVGVLAVLSAVDLVAGRVEPDRLATHVLVLAGFVLLLLHRRVLGDDGGRSLLRDRRDRRPRLAVDAPDAPLPWTDPSAGPGAVAGNERRAA